MADESWGEALVGIATALRDAAVGLWKNDIWPLMMGMGFFLALAAPLLLVIAVLWYLDATGWRAGGGFYTIGAAATQPWACAASMVTALCPGSARWRQAKAGHGFANWPAAVGMRGQPRRSLCTRCSARILMRSRALRGDQGAVAPGAAKAAIALVDSAM